MATRPASQFVEYVRYPNAPGIVLSDDLRDLSLVRTGAAESVIVDTSDMLPDVDWDEIERGKKVHIHPVNFIESHHSMFPVKEFLLALGKAIGLSLQQWIFHAGVEDVTEGAVPLTMYFHVDQLDDNEIITLTNIDGIGTLFPCGDYQTHMTLYDEINGMRRMKDGSPVRSFALLKKQKRLLRDAGINIASVPVGHTIAMGSRQLHATPMVPNRLTILGHFRPK